MSDVILVNRPEPVGPINMAVGLLMNNNPPPQNTAKSTLVLAIVPPVHLRAEPYIAPLTLGPRHLFSLYLDHKHNAFRALWRSSAVILSDSRAVKSTDRTFFQSDYTAKPGGDACCFRRATHWVLATTRPRELAN